MTNPARREMQVCIHNFTTPITSSQFEAFWTKLEEWERAKNENYSPADYQLLQAIKQLRNETGIAKYEGTLFGMECYSSTRAKEPYVISRDRWGE